MPTPVETLKKVLHLEKEYNYQDRAMIGGLARYADTWLREAGRTFGPEATAWVGEIARRLRDYSTRPPQERPQALEGLLQLLEAGPQSMPVEPMSGPSVAEPLSPCPGSRRPARQPNRHLRPRYLRRQPGPARPPCPSGVPRRPLPRNLRA
jgi:hypothetical protein